MRISSCFVAIALVSVLLCGSLIAYGNPWEEWSKTFGGPSVDFGNSVLQTYDGGYIIAGNTLSYGAGKCDAWLIKTDSQGNEEWDRTFGGPYVDYCWSAQQTLDGGYIITGYTESYGAGGTDAWLIKTDSQGNEEWSRTFGGTAWDYGQSVQQTTDEGYIIVGSTESYGFSEFGVYPVAQSDIWLIKTDSQGNEEWNRTFGGFPLDCGWAVQQTYDGGYIIAGETESFGAGKSDVWLIKTNSRGIIRWSRTFGGSDWDYSYSVLQTPDGGYVIAGDTYSYGAGGSDAWLIKTNFIGIKEWSQTVGGSATNDYAYSLQQTSDGGYIMVGTTLFPFGTDAGNVSVIKTDSQGNEEWSRTFGGPYGDGGSSVQQTTDGGYIIAGYTESYGAGGSDVWLIKIGPSPAPLSTVTKTGDHEIRDNPTSAIDIPSKSLSRQHYPNWQPPCSR